MEIVPGPSITMPESTEIAVPLKVREASAGRVVRESTASAMPIARDQREELPPGNFIFLKMVMVWGTTMPLSIEAGRELSSRPAVHFLERKS